MTNLQYIFYDFQTGNHYSNVNLSLSCGVRMVINCPACKKEFLNIVEEPAINTELTCPHCGTRFEVTWLYPLTFERIEEEIISSNNLFSNQ